jgi:hypothetical protein
MRVLQRNKKDLWFANRTGETLVVDDNGLKTGEREQTYGTPQKIRVSMSMSSGANNLGSQGMVTLDPYGLTTAYTHNAITEDMNCPMTEESIVWYGIEPTRTVTVTKTVNGETVTEEQTVSVPHNFKVVRKAVSLNHLIYYLKEVDVS